MPDLKEILRVILALIMIFAGVVHFARPNPFVKIVPKFLPKPLWLVYISGFFEILGGIGLCIPIVASSAAWGLIALYIAVFPANVNMAVHGMIPRWKKAEHSAARPPQKVNQISTTAKWILWLRLPLQLVLIAWAAWYI